MIDSLKPLIKPKQLSYASVKANYSVHTQWVVIQI